MAGSLVVARGMDILKSERKQNKQAALVLSKRAFPSAFDSERSKGEKMKNSAAHRSVEGEKKKTFLPKTTMAESWDSSTRSTVQKLPLLTVRAGPRDAKEEWEKRLKEELQALIAYVQMNKASDSDWFTISADKGGTKWSGTCWYVHEYLRYEFAFEFETPATYPATAPEVKIPALDGRTAKMYRGGAICLTLHFKPLWSRNAPHFGVAHALCLGLAPWLAAEVPHLVAEGVVQPKG